MKDFLGALAFSAIAPPLAVLFLDAAVSASNATNPDVLVPMVLAAGLSFIACILHTGLKEILNTIKSKEEKD